ncbi:MAG: DNA polymerase domain-containing protein, partial [Halococcoides sp.]
MLTVQFEEGDAIVWETTADSARPERHAYTPALFVGGPSKARTHVRAALADDPKVASLDTVHRYPDLHADEREPVLRVAVERVGEIRTLAREIRTRHEAGSFAPGTLRLYDVDLDPGARYCLDTGRSPVPDRDLRTLALDLPAAARADDDLSGLRIDGDPVSGGEARTLAALADRLERVDPDVLVCSTGRIVPLVVAAADRHGIDCPLGRRPGVTQRAGANTVESYGRVLHSPARYAVPGRVIVDREGSFLYDEGGLPGLRDLAARSRRPLQATARGSIGTILTSIEIREARSRDVLVPWNKWEPEAFSTVPTLHDADRGGFTFAPAVGVHEDMIEVDFASLYPSIMVEYNVSPETVGCDCCANDRVPGLDYSICEERGFMADVLDPLIQDRADMKARIAADGIGDDERERLEAQADALKWILVSSFGYQGYRNAKYGRIEAHEAINAFAREILLDAKDRLEAAGWRVVHGIVDSLWVTARDDPDPI